VWWGCRFTGVQLGRAHDGVGHAPGHDRLLFFPGALFGAISVGWFAYLATVFVMNARAHNLPSPRFPHLPAPFNSAPPRRVTLSALRPLVPYCPEQPRELRCYLALLHSWHQ